jgi:hypothetical protein
VNASDAVIVRNYYTTATYNVFADVNGDGIVDTNDFNEVRKRIGTHL